MFIIEFIISFKLEVGKSYWAWVQHNGGAASYEIEVVSREGDKIYAKFCGGYGDDAESFRTWYIENYLDGASEKKKIPIA